MVEPCYSKEVYLSVRSAPFSTKKATIIGEGGGSECRC